AEDGIRDRNVTGVQTCALPIYRPSGRLHFLQSATGVQPTEFTHRMADDRELLLRCATAPLRDTYENAIGALYIVQDITALRGVRSEERRVGKECRAGWWRDGEE